MTDLTTAEKRAALTPRGAPYFYRVSPGRHLGFRRGPQTWVARMQQPVRKHHTIGHEGDYTYETALAAALEWFAKGGDETEIAPSKLTVGLVCSHTSVRTHYTQSLNRCTRSHHRRDATGGDDRSSRGTH